MGVVYQAIVVRARGTAVDYAVRGFPTGMACLQPSADRTLTVVLLPLGPGRGFDVRAPHLAAELSRQFGSSLLVQYDDRIGVRESVLYAGGRPTRAFGLTDELWVPLDERGEPREGAQLVRVTEFDPNEEYDGAVSAVDLGLQAFGVKPPLTGRKLRDLILDSDG